MYKTKFAIILVDEEYLFPQLKFLNSSGNMALNLEDKITFDTENEAIKFIEKLDFDDAFPIFENIIIVKVLEEK